MSQIDDDGFEGVAHQTSQWVFFAETLLGRDVRTVMSPLKSTRVDDLRDRRMPEVRAFHLSHAQRRASLDYWVPTTRAKSHFVPRRFGAFVRASVEPNATKTRAPNVALLIEYLPDIRRHAPVKATFEWEDDLAPGSLRTQDIRACPLDQWTRRAVEAMVHAAEYDSPGPGQVTLRSVHDEADKRRVTFFALEDEFRRAAAGTTPSRRRDQTRRARLKELRAIAAEYQTEMDRHAESGKGHAAPIPRIVERFGLTIATAKRRVIEARDEGFLPPAKGRRAG
jgi:hypothetical protein